MNCHLKSHHGLIGVVTFLCKHLTVNCARSVPCVDDDPLFVPAGLQSPRAAGPTQRHDEGRLHGATPSLVLLHRPRTSSVWDQSHLGLQSGQTSGHCHTHAGHRQVQSLLTFVDQIGTYFHFSEEMTTKNTFK